jgi:ferric-dicitrate binding protein FerR (iron transport regulator)
MRRSPREKLPRTDAEVLARALREEKQRQDKRKRQRRAVNVWAQVRRYLDKRVLLALALLLVIIIADGVRRENREFEARLTELSGEVWWAESESDSEQLAEEGHRFVDGNSIRTGPEATATLHFPDGSFVTMEPDTEMVVRLLEYNRAGKWRMRSLYVKAGKIINGISPEFGQDSEFRVYTPTCVAAVRGTVFYVEQDPYGQEGQVACYEGTVSTRGHSGFGVSVTPGDVAYVPRGGQPDAYAAQEIGQEPDFGVGALWEPPPGAGPLQRFEYGVTYMLNAPLNILGIGKAGWALGTLDAARRTTCQTALSKLNNYFYSAREIPDYLDPATLQPLRIDPKMRRAILEEFHGGAISFYETQPRTRSFTLYVRARDRNRTLYKLTSAGVQKATPQEEQLYP